MTIIEAITCAGLVLVELYGLGKALELSTVLGPWSGTLADLNT